jgi:hypothetical protein
LASSERDWNEKYPDKFPLVNIDSQWEKNEESTLNKEETNNHLSKIYGNHLAFKKLMHKMPNNEVNFEHCDKMEDNCLSLITEEDRKWVAS